MAEKSNGLFKQLTRLFRSGPAIRRKIKTLDTTMATANREKSSGVLLFQRSSMPTYASITNSAYNIAERTMRYQDFNEMDVASPEISSALDVYSDETASQDEKGIILHVYSEHEKIKAVLEDLFYHTLNVEHALRSWARNIVKYGDMFLYIDVSPTEGVVNAFPIAVNEIEREDNYDPNDPFATRFRWVALGNKTLENWEVAHFRLLGNDVFLPYGTSVIEAARRIWRQLVLAEDAMLVYRITRAPERRVFKIDVGNIAPEEVDMFMEEQRKNLKTSAVVDAASGRVDLRYNPFSAEEDFFVPTRGKESGTEITTLQGGVNTAAIEDVAYLQKKLFSALKVPKAYLGYEDMLGSKSTLSQMDIRFSRTIGIIQKSIIAELNKIAIIHLYALGFSGDDLLNFTLHLSNPSTVAQQQKLELWRTKFEIAGSAPEGVSSKNFIRREIWGLTDDQCKEIDDDRYTEKIVDVTIEGLGVSEDADAGGSGGGGSGGGGGGSSGGGEAGGDDDLGDILGGDDDGGEGSEEPEEPAADDDETPPEENAGEEPEEDGDPNLELLTAGDNPNLPKVDLNKLPVNVKRHLDKVKYNRSRRRTHGSSKTEMPDFKKSLSIDDPGLGDPYDMSGLKAVSSNPLGEVVGRRLGLPPDIQSALERLTRHHAADMGNSRDTTMLSEQLDVDFEDNPLSGLFIDDDQEEV